MNKVTTVRASKNGAIKALFAGAILASLVVLVLIAPTSKANAWDDVSPDWGAAEFGGWDTYVEPDWGGVEYGGWGSVEPDWGSPEFGCDWDCGYSGGSDGCWDCGYDYDYGCWDCGGGYYAMPSYSYSAPKYTPTTYKPSSGGGHYSVAPRSYTPVTVSGGGGSQTQNQDQSQTVTVSNNNENTNNNVNINNNTAIAVAQVQLGGQTATYPTYPSYPSYPTYPAPYCTINQAQYGSYNYGTARQAYLSWTSSNAQSAYLSNYGSVAVNGSQTVYPSYTTTYTLTVYGYNGQQATCQTTVYVNTYTPPTYTPTTPYVSLTQIPYTGFDFGPFGNAMYWAGLAILALGGAYLAVYFIPQVAFATYSNRRFQPVVAPKAPILVEKEHEAKFAKFVAALDKKTGTNDTMAIVQANGSLPKIVIDRS